MIYEQQRRHSARLERLSALLAEMGATPSRAALLELTTERLRSGFGYERVAFHATEGEGGLRLEREARGPAAFAALPPDPHLLSWAARGAQSLQAQGAEAALVELAVPVRAGDEALGVLDVCKAAGEPFGEEEVNLLQAAARQLAVALQRSASVARTERLAAQMAALYDVGLETAALRDLRVLFSRATQEAGRLIHADHTSVLRFDPEEGCLNMFAAWGRDPARETYASPRFRLGEGVAGRVARDRLSVLVNDPAREPDFLPRANPVARLICVPLTFHEQGRAEAALFGILSATRRPGAPPFTEDDLSYVNRFANQLSIAVANSMAFQAERQRSEQLALVNTLLREIAGKLSRDRIVETACRRIQEAFRHPLVAIEWPDAEAGRRRLAAVACSAPRLPVWGAPPLEAGIVGRAVRERRTVLVPDVSEAPDAPARLGVARSLAAVPVVSGEEVMAVLYLESDARHGFDRGQVITLETLADGLGIILRNAELYQALESNNARLVELDRMKSELVNIVAHDFRAPLAGVLGHAELLEWRPEGPLEERVAQARAIVDSATHMANLVDKTLKTTRLETGHFPFEFALVDLAVVLRRTVARVPESATHPLTLDLPEEPLPVWADQDRVGEVVDNLVSNAVKYSPDGGKVEIHVRHEGDTVGVSVSDRGVGIEEQHLVRLFRPFSRVRDRRTASIEGSGLGLYICERVVKAHGGRISVTSHPGEGSTFSFTLPLYGVAAQTRPPLVLVAAADEPTRRTVRRVAEEQGFAVHEAVDGVEALEAALRLQPVVLVVERVLPRLGAVEVARRLQLNPHTEGVRLIALAEAEDLGDAASLFGACLARPFDPHRLASCLEALAAAPGLPAAAGLPAASGE
jgi:signal transduction histidine kinase